MSDLKDIDYAPLGGMQHATKHVFRSSIATIKGKLLFAFLVVIIPIGLGLTFFSLVGAAFGPIIYGIMLAGMVSKYKNALWEQFALANGWPLDITTPILEMVPPSMQFGHSQHFSPVIQAQLEQVSSDLFSYNTTVGSGKSQHTYYYTVARVQLPVVLPHMLLLSKKAGAELQRDLSKKQDIQLEGDFDDYFKLQIEQGQQIDALTVITPDIMQTLIQYNQAEDIEILADSLFFVLNFDVRDAVHVQHLIESVVALSKQILQNVDAERGSTLESSLSETQLDGSGQATTAAPPA